MKRSHKKDNNEKDLLRAGLILRTPALFDGVKKRIEQIYSIINTYIPRKDYQVIKGGLNSIYSIVFKYIDVRNGTFFPSSIIQAYDFSSDNFLNDVLEKLAALHRIAAKEKDLELSKEIIDCFAKIAVKCTEINYRATSMSEYTHCVLAAQYMQQSIEGCLSTDLLDIGINGSQNLKTIGIILIAKNAHTDVRMIIEHLSKIAMFGIAKPNASFLISYPMQAYSTFLRAWLFSKDTYDQFLPKTILEKVQTIAEMYIRFKDLPTDPFAVQMQYALGDFLDLSKPIAMPYIFDEAYKLIADNKTDDETRQKVIDDLLDFGHEIWHFYDALAKASAEKESFMIHFIDANIFHITMALLRFHESGFLSDEQKGKLRNDMAWIVSDYWRIYNYHTKISRTYEMQIMENLLRIGYEFNKLSFLKEFDEVIGIIVSIAESFLEKQKNSYGFDPMRILEKAAYLCILNNSDDVKNKFIGRIKDKFWKDYLTKYPHKENKELLFKELSRIDPERLKMERHPFSFKDTLLSELKKEDVDNFVSYLKEKLEG
jgi:hypothetical protein